MVNSPQQVFIKPHSGGTKKEKTQSYLGTLGWGQVRIEDLDSGNRNKNDDNNTNRRNANTSPRLLHTFTVPGAVLNLYKH